MTEEKRKWLFQRPDDESSRLLMEWWQDLENHKGDRAVLRRADNSTEVMFSPLYHRLLKSLQDAGYSINREDLAIVCGLAVHVREIKDLELIAQQMADSKPGGEKARLSGLRFRRLLAIQRKEELYLLMIRVIHFLDKKVNLTNLAQSVYWWNESTKKQWAFDYYSKAPQEV